MMQKINQFSFRVGWTKGVFRLSTVSLLSRLKRKRGFSLIEVLTAVTIGGIVLSAVMISFASFHKTTERLDHMRQLQRETNFTLNRMIDRVRQYSIDYAEYEKQNLDPGGTDQLFIGNDQGVFAPRKREGSDGVSLFFENEPLFSADFLVADIFFSVTPDRDPYTNVASLNAQRQPRVQVKLQVVSRKDPAVRISLQTTISSRDYQ